MVTRHTQICVDEQELDEFKAELAQLRERHERALKYCRAAEIPPIEKLMIIRILEGTDQ